MNDLIIRLSHLEVQLNTSNIVLEELIDLTSSQKELNDICKEWQKTLDTTKKDVIRVRKDIENE